MMENAVPVLNLRPRPITVPQTLWANFQDICQLMKRQPEHVFSFVVAELGTEGSIDGNQRLVLRGQFLRFVFALMIVALSYDAVRGVE